MITLPVDHDMKPRTVLGAAALAAMPMFLATPAHALGLDILNDEGRPEKDIPVANRGPVGPGLSALAEPAEAIVRHYGITKTYADIVDLDAGHPGAIVGEILDVNGKEGLIAAPEKLLGHNAS
ncbi:hypothetical protein ACWGAN_07075 [Streptomyces sp. NPDC054945]